MTHIGPQTSSQYHSGPNARQYLALHATSAPQEASAAASSPSRTSSSASVAAPTAPQSAHAPLQPVDANLQTSGHANPPAIDLVDQLGIGGHHPPTEPLNDELTVEGLMEVWHTDDATYDLDGNGIVNVSDLLALLDQMGPE